MNRQADGIELRSPLPPAECARRINAAIDGWDDQYSSHDARGAADATGFRIRRNWGWFWRRQIIVFMDAWFEPEGEGTRLRCSFELDPYAVGFRKVVFAVASLSAIFMAFATLQRGVPGWNVVLANLAFVVVMILSVTIEYLMTRYDQEVLTELVRTTLEAPR